MISKWIRHAFAVCAVTLLVAGPVGAQEELDKLARARLSPRSSTPAAPRRSASRGRKRGARLSSTRMLSAALQTPGRCTFAL